MYSFILKPSEVSFVRIVSEEWFVGDVRTAKIAQYDLINKHVAGKNFGC